jgi:hypothetical protein
MIGAVVALTWVGCAESPIAPEAPAAGDISAGDLRTVSKWVGARQTRDYSSDVAREWMGLSYQLVKVERWSPPVASRFWGYAGVALYEAVRAGIPGSLSLEGQLNGLEAVPDSPARYHWPAVANAALNVVFDHFFANASADSRAKIAELHLQLANQYRAEGSPAHIAASEQFGVAIGEAIRAWSEQDGFGALNNCAYTPPTGPGQWVPTPPNNLPPLQPCWGEIRCAVVSDGAACDPGPHPPYSEVPGSDFYREGREVYDTVENITPEQLAIAQFWADAPGATGTPPGHWIKLLGQLLGEWDSTLDVAAEAYARVGLAEMDAFICCWFVKYELNLLRPVTYVRLLFQADWLPPLITPNFPEYPSGHSTQSGAVAEVLTDMFGVVPYTDHTHDEIGLPPRSFESFRQAADEAAISRLYGGIHYRAAIERGLEQGRCIGGEVNALEFGERLLARTGS